MTSWGWGDGGVKGGIRISGLCKWTHSAAIRQRGSAEEGQLWELREHWAQRLGLAPTHPLGCTRRLKGALCGQLNRWDLLHRRHNPSSSSSYKNPREQVRSPREMTDGERTVEPRGDTVQVKNLPSYQRVKNLGLCWKRSFDFWMRTKKSEKKFQSLWGLWDPLPCQKEVSFKIRSFLSASISLSVLLKG